MARRYTGGFISATEQATDSNTANGIFTLAEAQEKTALGNFPTGRWTPSRSLRFRNSNSAYISRTPSVAGNKKTWTISFWLKTTKSNFDYYLLEASTNSTTDRTPIGFNAGKLNIRHIDANSTVCTIETTQVFRDPSAWYHIVIAFDTTQAIDLNRVKVYVNGSQVTSFGTATYLAQNTASRINQALAHQLGRYISATNYFDGYMAEVNFVDGQALTASSFGQFDANNNWLPKGYTGTYGTNGY